MANKRGTQHHIQACFNAQSASRWPWQWLALRTPYHSHCQSGKGRICVLSSSHSQQGVEPALQLWSLPPKPRTWVSLLPRYQPLRCRRWSFYSSIYLTVERVWFTDHWWLLDYASCHSSSTFYRLIHWLKKRTIRSIEIKWKILPMIMFCHIPVTRLFNGSVKRSDIFSLLHVCCCILGPQLDLQLQNLIIIIIILNCYFISLFGGEG